MRIKQRKIKTTMREGTKDVWSVEGGIDTKRKRDDGYVCLVNSVLIDDKVRPERR